MPLARRTILTGGAAAGVGLVVAGAAPTLAEASPQDRRPHPPVQHRPFPPLVDDPRGLLALPPGFKYQVVTYAGKTKLDGGTGVTPSNHDGTAVFDAGHGKLRLIQNHELPAGSPLGVPHVKGTVYDPTALMGGGCTVIETDRRGRNHGEWVGISGTLTNCAGGPSPWGTWLTCEETETEAGAAWSGNGQTGTYSKDHGYVFEVFADGHGIPKPIKAFGRYAHEALAIEPSRKRVYLSEDASNPNGLFYRWTAPHGVKLKAGMAHDLGATAGVLEAMAMVMDDGSILPDVAYITSAQLGRPFPVKWVPVPERDGQTTSVRKQFTDEITRGKKFEGVYGTDKGVYVVFRLQYSRPADRCGQARRHGVVLLLRGPHHHAGDVLPAPDHHRLRHEAPLRRCRVRRPGQRGRHPVGDSRPGRGRRRCLARPELRSGWSDIRNRA